MDGVERVMVLGILAVIVAILSFAWSATDEGTTPVGALERESGLSGAGIPLSSHSPAGDPVVLGEADRARITERMNDNNAAREAQLRKRWELMNEGQTGASPSKNGALLADEGSSQVPAPDQPVAGVKPSAQIALKPDAARNESSEDGSDAPNFRDYTVVGEDTLWGLARNTVGAGGDTKRMVAHIQELNPGLEPSTMFEGRTIKLPLAPVQTPPLLQTPGVLLAPTPGPALILEERAPEGGGRVYIVGAGDTLNSIAAYELGDGKRWKEIYQLNKATIPDPDRIQAGQRLFLPAD